MKENSKYQTICLTFSDGKKATFTGKAVSDAGDKRTITNIYFTPPEILPDGYSFEIIPRK